METGVTDSMHPDPYPHNVIHYNCTHHQGFSTPLFALIMCAKFHDKLTSKHLDKVHDCQTGKFHDKLKTCQQTLK